MRSPQLLLLAGLIACSGSDGQGPGDGNGGPEGDVVVRNFRFDPAALEVTAGTTVVWAWSSGGTSHNVTFEGGSPTSGNQTEGTYGRNFPAIGEFSYQCTIHPSTMSGVISVVAAPAPGPGGDGDGGGGDGGGYLERNPGGY